MRGFILEEYLIGTGGWAYFHIPRLNPLLAYSRIFNFVEVNSTFYQIPPLEEVERWRRRVPPDFQFTVRAHQTITHKHKLQPTQEALVTFEKMKEICNTLRTGILHLQTPPSFKPTRHAISDLRNLVTSSNLGKLRLALEMRGTNPSKLPSQLSKVMQEHDIIHCTDISKGETPAYNSDILYSRLFGKGEHNVYQPTDEELAEIDNKASNGNFQKVIMSFHFVRMYKDATRLKIYKETGKFPQLTGSTGLSSLEEVLSEDARFPSTNQDLVRSQGWKLFDLSEERRVHARELLQQLPEGTYNNIAEVRETLQSRIR